MCVSSNFDLKNLSDLTIHITEQHQQHKQIFICLRCGYKAKNLKGLREHEGGQHGDYEEHIDYEKEMGSNKPFKCMKCNHDSKTRAKIARHLFTKHSSAVIIRINKAVPAKQVKEAGL